ncbi:hypothetical protein POJ06DRAFT_269910 [Lipomyces tetrasporus]|uniref:Uncharacterized protein n=1 Tax=Lipomyces tetrasporus TaxID=54092 RepID=A0AAD7QS85_9ASCO|nr:uncharacterized protein POJ06DRAFT_269910 [Lipomyces tetrasporus]KAJ8098837.1 hypothetical protein POJ06DRAFT_269910 [Lipomyces tetrasporus]
MPSFRFTGWHAARIIGACVVLLILFAAPTPKSTRSALDQANYTPSGFKYVPPWQKDPEPVTDNGKAVVSENSASNPAPPPAPASFPPPPPSPPSFPSDAPPPFPASVEQPPAAESVVDSVPTVEPPAAPEATDAAIEEPPVEEDPVLPTTDKRSSVNIFLMNIPRYHFEVVLPLLHAFSSLPSANVTLIASPSGYNRFGVGPLLEREAKPYGLQLVDQKLISPDLGTPDFLFLTSCPEDIVKANKTITKWLAAGTRVQCIAHEPSKWDARPSGNSQYTEQIKYMVPWIEKGQWEIVVLAPHVQKFVRENFPTYFGTSENVVYKAPIIHPVFKANKEDVEVDFVEPFAAIPGKYEPWRRNYDRIFQQYEQARPQAKLHLVGSGDDLSVPEAIKSRIVYVRDLTFPEYFEHLGKSVTLIPAFGSEAYILHQASSTVATALIVGTPLLANSTIAQAYSQIPEDAMWLQEPGESEMDAFGRISFIPVHLWAEKKAKVAEVRDKMIAENVEFFESVAQEISDSKSKKSSNFGGSNGDSNGF